MSYDVHIEDAHGRTLWDDGWNYTWNCSVAFRGLIGMGLSECDGMSAGELADALLDGMSRAGELDLGQDPESKWDNVRGAIGYAAILMLFCDRHRHGIVRVS